MLQLGYGAAWLQWPLGCGPWGLGGPNSGYTSSGYGLSFRHLPKYSVTSFKLPGNHEMTTIVIPFTDKKTEPRGLSNFPRCFSFLERQVYYKIWKNQNFTEDSHKNRKIEEQGRREGSQEK